MDTVTHNQLSNKNKKILQKKKKLKKHILYKLTFEKKIHKARLPEQKQTDTIKIKWYGQRKQKHSQIMKQRNIKRTCNFVSRLS